MYGVARSLLALSTLTSLVLNPPVALFRAFGSPIRRGSFDPATAASLFTIVPSLEVARWAAVVVLLLVISGWRPRLTGLLHWYVAASFSASCFITEGGDQVAAILALLLVPITLTDPRRWHWQAPPERSPGVASDVAWSVASPAWTVIRLQVAVIYLHASVGKMSAPEWVNGTAMYYWVQHPLFGVPEELQHYLVAGLSNAFVVTAATWGVMVYELLLAAGLVMERKYRPLLLYTGLLFHLGIVAIHGLGTFFFSMAGALVLYLRAPENVYSFAFTANMRTVVVRAWQRRVPVRPAGEVAVLR